MNIKYGTRIQYIIYCYLPGINANINAKTNPMTMPMILYHNIDTEYNVSKTDLKKKWDIHFFWFKVIFAFLSFKSIFNYHLK